MLMCSFWFFACCNLILVLERTHDYFKGSTRLEIFAEVHEHIWKVTAITSLGQFVLFLKHAFQIYGKSTPE